ncbi:cytochrome P450 [Halosolutus gelatinilyticus]|uniref:cytochrome P450 n=1 Tax=Halosolutus gelatinilyticus TaxID=2931975 RepID=UPI001FF24431|nr:cytochrome P450 [Halosolutus gelatinilyticus]
MLGEGLLTARGESWERGREHVQPAFYPGRLEEYARDMLDRSEATVADWEDGQRIDVYERATDLTLSIAATTMFGADRIAETDVIADAAEAITTRFEPSRVPVEIPLWVPTPAPAVSARDGQTRRRRRRPRSATARGAERGRRGRCERRRRCGRR